MKAQVLATPSGVVGQLFFGPLTLPNKHQSIIFVRVGGWVLNTKRNSKSKNYIRGLRLATIGGERRMEDKHKLLRETEQIKFSEYGLDYCEWGCEKHNINRIWISDSRAVCLQCAVEELGFEVVSDWFNKKLRLQRL